MPSSVLAVNVVSTKLASGNVLMAFHRPGGGSPFMVVIPAADFTAFNTTVNGGATGATLTTIYAQDQNLSDYPVGAWGFNRS